MKQWVVINKEIGETPLAALNKWKRENPAYESVLASYAGRLDPMARGRLLILLGAECKQQKKYVNLDKEYEIEVLFDVGSDTGDALGLVEYASKETKLDRADLQNALAPEMGSHRRPYPQFSSKTVNGKPLFLHTLEGMIDTVTIPEHEEQIYKIRVRHITNLSSSTLASRVEGFLAKVPRSDQSSKRLGADFRIEAVQESWKTFFEKAGDRSFVVISLCVTCGSGTYMRSLADRIGENLGTNALAFSINRTKIGKYWHGWWVKKY